MDLDAFRALFDQAAIGMVMVEPRSGRYVRANKAFCEIAGYTEQELQELTDLDLAHPEDLAAARQMAEGQSTCVREKRYVRKSGEVRWVRVTARLVPGARKDLLMSVVEDITERKRAELHARFLSDVQATMARLQDAGELATQVLNGLARHLQVDLAVFGEVAGDVITIQHEYRDAVPSAVGAHRIGDYVTKEAWDALVPGSDFVATDIAADPRTSRMTQAFRRVDIGAFAAVPLIGPKGLLATLGVGSRQPRAWRPDEVQLLHDLAARLFPAVERAKAEQALREREELLQLALQGGEAGAWEQDLETGRRVWGAGIRKLLGLAPEAAEGEDRRWSEFVHPDDVAMVSSKFRRAREEDAGAWNADYRVVRADGAVRWLNSRAMVVARPGRHRKMIGVVQDITLRKEAEQKLAESQAMLSKAQRIARLGSWELDLRDPGRYRNAHHWSDEVFRLFGYQPNEVAASNELFFSHIPAEERSAIRTAVQRTLRDGVPYDIEHRIVRRDGVLRFVHGRAEVQRDAAGMPRRLVGTVQDITERKEAEEAVREADRRKDQFLATLSHELRNPLAPLSNALQIMRRGGASLGMQALSVAERQLAHMVRLIDDLLDSSRIARGLMDIRRERMDLANAVVQAVETSRPLIEDKGHSLEIDLPQDPIVVEGDMVRLTQVFSNLLNNAARYTAPGGRVGLRVRRAGAEAVVEVSDNGIGIAREVLPRLFQMFSQFARDPDFSAGGLGVGLALVRGITELHGGRIEATSEGLGKGSTFTVRIPVAAERGVQEPAAVAAAGPAASLRVLVADDNVDAAESLALLLELMGHTPRVVHDGVQAVEAAAEFAPDVVFMDLGMPRLNGLEATRKIKRRGPGNAPLVYALTGWGQDNDRSLSREAGCDGHLVKPPSAEDLERALAMVEKKRVR